MPERRHQVRALPPRARRSTAARRQPGCSARTCWCASRSATSRAEHRVLQRDEHADAAGRRIDRAGERDDEEQREVVDHAHRRRRSRSSGLRPRAAAGGDRGARRRRPIPSVSSAEPSNAAVAIDADLQRREPEREQVDRQQDGDEPVDRNRARPALHNRRVVAAPCAPTISVPSGWTRTMLPPVPAGAAAVAELGHKRSWRSGESACPHVVKLAGPARAPQRSGRQSSFSLG